MQDIFGQDVFEAFVRQYVYTTRPFVYDIKADLIWWKKFVSAEEIINGAFIYELSCFGKMIDVRNKIWRIPLRIYAWLIMPIWVVLRFTLLSIYALWWYFAWLISGVADFWWYIWLEFWGWVFNLYLLWFNI